MAVHVAITSESTTNASSCTRSGSAKTHHPRQRRADLPPRHTRNPTGWPRWQVQPGGRALSARNHCGAASAAQPPLVNGRSKTGRRLALRSAAASGAEARSLTSTRFTPEVAFGVSAIAILPLREAVSITVRLRDGPTRHAALSMSRASQISGESSPSCTESLQSSSLAER
jgi:hypothetical protein